MATKSDQDKPASNRFPKVLGRGYVDRGNEVVLIVGTGKKRRMWTRLQMAWQLRSVDFVAARDFVTPVLREMGITSVAMIAGMDSSRFWKHKVPGKSRRLGVSSMNVLMSLIKHELRRNPYDWVAGENNDLVTLATLKNREKSQAKKRKKR